MPERLAYKKTMLTVAFSDRILTIVFRAVQEGLTNIQRHSKASYAKIVLEFSHNHIYLLISDNGQGFEVTSILTNRKGSYGLAGLQERLRAISGTLTINSKPNQGTQLQLTIPRKIKRTTKK